VGSKREKRTVSDTYQIILTGSPEPGQDQATVVDALATLFSIDAQKATELLGGQETVIKKNVDAETAQKYQAAVRQAGAQCRLVADDPAAPATRSEVAGGTAGDVPPPVAPPAPVSGEASGQASASNTGHSADPFAVGAGPDPYAPPQAALTSELPEGAFHEPIGVSTGRGMGWIGEGWTLFKGAPTTWVLMTLVFIVLSVVLSFIPLLGSLAIYLAYPVFTGSFMLCAHHVMHGEEIRVGDLFLGFKERMGPLLGVGGVYLAGTIGIVAIVGIFAAVVLGANAPFLGQFSEGSNIGSGAGAAMASSVAIVVLISLLAFFPLVMAIWFAPALIILHKEVTVSQALKLSFMGCLRNILPFLLYGIVLFILMTVAMIPIGLGLLVVAPIAFCSLYASYRDIYFDN
jgi:uncharacterized membrane protein